MTESNDKFINHINSLTKYYVALKTVNGFPGAHSSNIFSSASVDGFTSILSS